MESRALPCSRAQGGQARTQGHSMGTYASSLQVAHASTQPTTTPCEHSLSPESFPPPVFTVSDSNPEDDWLKSVFTQTRSETQSPPPPALISPIKCCTQAAAAPVINKKSDIKVWDMQDEVIIGMFPVYFLFYMIVHLIIIDAARVIWHSDAYAHYDVTLQCKTSTDGNPLSLTFVFTCKKNPEAHHVILHPCSKTGEGTSNLVRTMNNCLYEQGLSIMKSMMKSQLSIPVHYSPTAHRTFIALHCAKYSCPFNFVADDEYQIKVNMLCPGTTLPSA